MTLYLLAAAKDYQRATGGSASLSKKNFPHPAPISPPKPTTDVEFAIGSCYPDDHYADRWPRVHADSGEMPAAFMQQRLCRLRPESYVAWTRRATLLAVRQQPTPLRLFATLPIRLATPSSAQAVSPESQVQDETSQCLSVASKHSPEKRRSRTQNKTRPHVTQGGAKIHQTRKNKQSEPSYDADAALEMLKDGYAASLENRRKPISTVVKKHSKTASSTKPRKRKVAAVVKNKAQAALANRRKPAVPVVQKHAKAASRRRVPSLIQRLEMGTPEERLMAMQQLKIAKERYDQWGYLRHQFVESEVVPARQRFNFYKRKIANILFPKNPSSWPWREDGKWLYELDALADMRQAWAELDPEVRRKGWPTVMLSALHSCPDRAHLVLEATLDPLPAGYAIQDTLIVIATRLNLKTLKTRRDRRMRSQELLEMLAKLIVDVPVGHIPFRQRTLGLFAKKLLPEQVRELYELLPQIGKQLHPNTRLQFARRLADIPACKQQAFDILSDLADNGADLNEPKYSSVVTTLLHVKDITGWSQGEPTLSPQRALQLLIEKGFSPNLLNFTAMIDSLCQHGEIEEAIRLSLILAETGVALDDKTYTTVFRGAKYSLNIKHVHNALDVAKAAKAPYMSVLDNMLHSIFYFAEMEGRDKQYPNWALPAFIPMLRVYAKKFELGPLQWLIPDSLPLMLMQTGDEVFEKFENGPARQWDFSNSIAPVADEFFAAGEGSKMQPSTTTLVTMLRAYIKGLSRPYDVMSYYNFFKSRLEDPGDSKALVERLVHKEGTIVHDTVILAMTERKGLIRPALQVFGDMLRDAIKAKEAKSAHSKHGVAETATDFVPVHPAPSLFTFSILINGLLKRRENILAEQILQVMQEQGIEPNLVTWNILARGYACLQNITRTVGTLQDLEAAGYKPDTYTFKAFGKLRDQTKALEMMEGIIDDNMKRLAQEQSV